MSLMERHDNDWPMWFGRRFAEWPAAFTAMLNDSTINVEEYRDGGHLVIRAELPGIDPDEDVEITIEDNVLHLRAERKVHSEVEDQKGYRSEFRYGSLARSIRLPAGADDADVTASYADGILEVRVPVDDSTPTAKKVEISRS